MSIKKYNCIVCNREFICSCSYEQDVKTSLRTCAQFGNLYPRSVKVTNDSMIDLDDTFDLDNIHDDIMMHFCTYGCKLKHMSEQSLKIIDDAVKEDPEYVLILCDLDSYDYFLAHLDAKYHKHIAYDPKMAIEYQLRNFTDVYVNKIFRGIHDKTDPLKRDEIYLKTLFEQTISDHEMKMIKFMKCLTIGMKNLSNDHDNDYDNNVKDEAKRLKNKQKKKNQKIKKKIALPSIAQNSS